MCTVYINLCTGMRWALDGINDVWSGHELMAGPLAMSCVWCDLLGPSVDLVRPFWQNVVTIFCYFQTGHR